MRIRLDDLTGDAILELLRVHMEFAVRNSPRHSRHALDAEALKAPDVTFYAAWIDEDLAGCGALRELDATHGEIKSMRTHAAHLRRGVAAAMLEHLLDVARSRGYRRVSLETGSSDTYVPARALYERFGFALCGPFSNYVVDPNSVFMTRAL
ncbi:MAG: GNAT family N-acetyltransferase [Planctomycetes bacterium]|nr:GNAT family N-acetyltransferase [Planctomycetota bacterium]